MIIPEKFQFTSDADARERMTAWIRENFSDVLGPKVNLLDRPNGIELISAEVKSRLAAKGIGVREEIAKAA